MEQVQSVCVGYIQFPRKESYLLFLEVLDVLKLFRSQVCEEKLLNFDSATFRFQRVSIQKQIKIGKSSDCF